MALTIEELLKSMLTIPEKRVVGDQTLPNNESTWDRIGRKDSFAELGFSSTSEKEAFLKSWIQDNPYSNI